MNIHFTLELKRRLLVLALTVAFISFGLWAPFEQTITGTAYLDAANSWSLRQYDSGLIASEWNRNYTNRDVVNQYFQLERSDITDIKMNDRLKDGSRVEIGDTIAFLHSREGIKKLSEYESELKREISRKNALVSGAKPEELDVVKSKLNSAKVQYETYQLEFERVKQLYEQDLVPLAEYQEVERKLMILEAEYELANKEVKAAEVGAHPAEVAVQDAEIKRMETLVNMSQDMLGQKAYIRSPLEGYVNMRGASDALLTVEDSDTMIVRIVLSETYASAVQEGSKIEVLLPGLDGRKFPVQITQVGFFGGDTTAVYGLGMLPNSQHQMKSGMHGISRIPVGKMTLFERVKNTVISSRW